MASVKPYGNGYRAQIKLLGVRDSETFRTKREAQAWASARETEIRAQDGKPPAQRYTLADALTRYAAEVSIHKRGRRWEEIRIKAFMAGTLPIRAPIGAVTPDMIGAWRDARLRTVGNGTVLREIALLSAVLEAARREWRWIEVNPVKDVRKPRQPDHRETLLTRQQIKAMLRALGYSPRLPIRSVTQSVAVAFLLALRTGMRAGELCGLHWSRVHDGWCALPVTKTTPREVPLSPKAMRVIGKMRGFDPVAVFGVTPQTLDTLFRRARDRAGLSGFVFHDSRHTAATWIVASGKWNVLELCKAFGWANPKQAMIYFNPKATDLAEKLR